MIKFKQQIEKNRSPKWAQSTHPIIQFQIRKQFSAQSYTDLHRTKTDENWNFIFNTSHNSSVSTISSHNFDAYFIIIHLPKLRTFFEVRFSKNNRLHKLAATNNLLIKATTKKTEKSDKFSTTSPQQSANQEFKIRATSQWPREKLSIVKEKRVQNLIGVFAVILFFSNTFRRLVNESGQNFPNRKSSENRARIRKTR